ncbi:LysR family transcriptional regulator [Okeania sp. KiyG1]|uniref:LysR family transcriptional regulator n=1 Tax=Okeania sp. KiyG1 TaxID=2720165 RepID=UPI001924B7D1|nr:LysR family transcriptional regulator [Okeania sp. KiyG1]GGA00500.1 LysR family transcriptional regulator [Okeania sp. KiyG1]
MDRLTLLNTFIYVTEAGSFSSAARLLGQTQSQVSKMIRRLEEEFQVSLFHRTTRKITLTEEGQNLLIHAKAIIERFNIAQEDLQGYQSDPKGKIRLLTSNGIGGSVVIEIIAKFLNYYPHIQIDHVVSDQFINMVENQIDVAIWLGNLKDSTLRARKIGLIRPITAATPTYLKKNGMPKKPEDLINHNCISFTRLGQFIGLGNRNTWQYLDKDGTPKSIEIRGNYQVDQSLFIAKAAMLDIGIYKGPSYLFFDMLNTGELIEILSEYEFETFPIYLLYHAGDFIPSRIKVFMDFISDEFRLRTYLSE